MTDKEKETIKEFDRLIKLRKNKAGEIKFDTCIVSTAQLETVVNLIQTQQVEIKEHKKTITYDNKKYEHMKKSLKGIISRSNAEIEKKDKVIDEMAPRIYLNKEEREEMKKDIYNNINHKGFADFVKRYFERKVETEDK